MVNELVMQLYWLVLFPSLTSRRIVQERPAITLLVNYGDNRN